jgi:hypothetical protein
VIDCVLCQIEIDAPELLIPDACTFEVEITGVNLKKCKSADSGQISAELTQAGGETLLPAIHKLINSVQNKEELRDEGSSLLLYQFTKTKRVMKLTVIIIVE